MAFIDVPHGGSQAQRAQGANAPHTQHQLLLQTHLPVAAIQLMGNGPIRLRVVRYVGIEQVQLDMPGLGRPHPYFQHTAGKFDVQGQVPACLGQGGHHRQIMRMRTGMADLLMPVAVNGLGKIAHLVQQPYGDKRQAYIAGRFTVIPRQNTQSAGIDGETLMEAKLQAEVGDQVFLGIKQLRQLRTSPVVPVGITG